jgi:signal peptidase II
MQAARGASLNSSEPVSPDEAAPRSRRRLWLVMASVAAVMYAVDVASKVLAVARLSDGQTVELLGPALGLHLTRNPGAAFSTGAGFTVALSLISICAALVVLWLARRLGSLWWAVGLGFLLAGVLGNLTDRLFRAPGPLEGHVVDFIQLPNWPVFNVADICINVAAGVIILQAVRGIGIDGSRHHQGADD